MIADAVDHDRTALRRILLQTRTIAVLGAHWEPDRPACYVPEYLAEVGYRVLPVNPAGVGREGFGARYVARLTELDEAVDMVDVFRRSALVADHVDEILAMSPRPKVVWLQLGVRNDDATARLQAAGIELVQDRCTLADHQALGLPRRYAPSASR
jgi:predicted CoA-binding protein